MKLLTRSLLAMILAITFVACSDDDDNGNDPHNVVYQLAEVDNSGVSGTATFDKISDTETRVSIVLSGTTDGNTHPAHIHFNSAAEGGDIAFPLTAVNGLSGQSVTNITQNVDGDAFTFEQLVNFDGYINVHLSAEDLATIVAQGNIGSNVP